MKIRKFFSAIISVAIAATVISAPAEQSITTTVKKEVSLPKATQSVSYEKKAETFPTDSIKAQPDSVEINASNFKQFENGNDSFYEPNNESISTLEDSTNYINDALTVFFKDSATDADKFNVVENLDGEIVGKVDFMNEYEIKIARSDFYEINNLCNRLMENDCVEFATCSLAEKSTPDYIPNDPWNFTYWDDDALNRSNAFSNWWIKATDIDKAWDYSDSFNNIKVGIVDSGFDPEHEDLQGRIEFPNSFFKKNNAPTYHGNHVAGIIGATHDNEIGLSGVVPNADMVCVDWEADEDQGQKWNNEARIMTGFVNTVRAGAKVINFSLGSSGSIEKGFDKLKIVKDTESRFYSYYIAKMLQRGYDFICCQSAGNGVSRDDITYAIDASNNGIFSAITEENAFKTVPGVSARDIIDRIIIVAAAQFDGYNTYEQCSFSNGGSQVSICAPGSVIYSAYYTGNENNHSSYTYLNGTSMAAPIVTGIATLVWSINPGFTGVQVKHFVCDFNNTKYEVADSSSENHFPIGTMRMVNAQLAVESAMTEIESYGTFICHLQWSKITPNKFINFTLTSRNDGTVYRFITDSNGNFSAKLPAGEYVLNLAGKRKILNINSGETSDIGTVRSALVFIDLDAYGVAIKDNMQDFLSKIQIY